MLVPSIPDRMESGSLSPTSIRRQREEYSPAATPDLSVKRFVMPDLGADWAATRVSTKILHSNEVDLFNAAFAALQTDNRVGNYPNNVVLVDTLVREKGLIKKECGHPEFHTVCLWKKPEEDGLFLIDPTNPDSTADLKDPLEGLLKVSIEVVGFRKKGPKSPYCKFYESFVAAPPIEGKPKASRDCVDIAVKLGFVINESQATDKDVTESIKKLSNQKDVNPCLTGIRNDIQLRELQSSDLAVRVKVLALLESNEQYRSKFRIQDLSDLEDLDGLRKTHPPTLDRLEMLDGLPLISPAKWHKFKSLIIKVDGLNEELTEIQPFSNLRIWLVNPEKKSYSRYIEDRAMQQTGLHLAVTDKKDGEIKNFLTEHGDNPELIAAQDINGRTALHIALIGKNDIAAALLIEKMEIDGIAKKSLGDGSTALHLAVHSGNNAMVERLLCKKDRSRSKDAKIIRSAFYGDVDEWGRTASYLAACNQDYETAVQLADVMADEDILKIGKGGSRFTALHCAVLRSDDTAVEKLAQERKIPGLYGMVDTNGWTALHWALHKGNYKAARLIISAMQPADIYKKTNIQNYTALHMVSHCNKPGTEAERLEIAKLLVGVNPDRNFIEARDTVQGSELTALQWARTRGHEEIAQYLEDVLNA